MYFHYLLIPRMNASIIGNQNKTRLLLLVPSSKFLSRRLRPFTIYFLIICQSHVEYFLLSNQDLSKINYSFWTIFNDYLWNGYVGQEFQGKSGAFFNFDRDYSLGWTKSHILLCLILHIECDVVSCRQRSHSFRSNVVSLGFEVFAIQNKFNTQLTHIVNNNLFRSDRIQNNISKITNVCGKNNLIIESIFLFS